MHTSATNTQIIDHKVFKGLFDKYYQTLCVFAASFLKNDALAADVVQEVFVKFWELQPEFDHIQKVQSYLYTAVRHTCLNIIRDEKKIILEEDLQRLESEAFFNDILIERESYRIFYSAVDTLPEQTRRIIYLAIDGLKNAEIAEQLNIAETTVHRLKKIAYKKLKVILKDYFYLFFIFVP